MKERQIFDETDLYAQITGIELTQEQLEQLGKLHAQMAEQKIPPTPQPLNLPKIENPK